VSVGLLFSKWRDHYGQDDDDVLVVQSTSLDLNPTLDPKIIKAALKRDKAVAFAEWLGEFRADADQFISRDSVLACVPQGVKQRSPVASTRYVSFCDPSGGALTGDCMSLAVAHLGQGSVEQAGGRK
jgi:hypothetical protein